MDTLGSMLHGAAMTLVVVVVVYVVFDLLAERQGYGPPGECLSQLRRRLRDRRHEQHREADAGLLLLLALALSRGRAVTVYEWLDGVPLRLVGYGELREPPIAARVAPHASHLAYGEICHDEYGVVVPLRSRDAELTGVLTLAPGSPPHPECARLLFHFGDLLAHLSPEASECTRVARASAAPRPDAAHEQPRPGPEEA